MLRSSENLAYDALTESRDGEVMAGGNNSAGTDNKLAPRKHEQCSQKRGR